MVVGAEDIRLKVSELVDGSISIREFQAWFVPATWELTEADTPAEGLAAEIELRLAEYTNGHWTDKELIDLLSGRALAGRR